MFCASVTAQRLGMPLLKKSAAGVVEHMLTTTDPAPIETYS